MIQTYINSLKKFPNQPNKDLLLKRIKEYLDQQRDAVTEYRELLNKLDVSEDFKEIMKEVVDEYENVEKFYLEIQA